jgi:hypothetical protein
MATAATEHPYPRVEFILDAIADWITRYRKTRAAHDEIARCDAEEVERIAQDIGISRQDLASLATRGPNSAALLERMLRALGVDAEAHDNPAVLHDLQRLCVACDRKQQCIHELASGGAAEHFRQFCPNAYTLDALLTEKGIKKLDRRH